MTSILEAVMLICFGCSWPLNVVKNWRACSAKNMSLLFILLIISGYIAGITAKVLSNNINYVLTVYLINLIIVSLNLLIYVRNLRMDHQKQRQQQLA